MLSQRDKFAISILPQDIDGEINKLLKYKKKRKVKNEWH